MGRIASAAALAIVLAVPAVWAGSGLKEGDTAPSFALPIMNPQTKIKRLRLDDWVGRNARQPKKAAIVSFFASYCEPCKKELPVLQKLHEKYGNKGLGITVVSIDKDEESERVVEELIKTHKVTLPVLRDRFNIVAKRYSVSALPSLYGLSGGGKVAFHSTGYKEEELGELLGKISKVLGSPVTVEVPGAAAAKPAAAQTTEAAPEAAKKPR